MGILRGVGLVALFASFAAADLQAGGLRIRLLASTEVQSDTILLANLLPASASRNLREVAGQISLGTAPQNGTAREFTRESLASAISSNGLSPADFTIPDMVTVRRDGRLISRQEVFEAVQAALARNSQAGVYSLRPADIALQTAVRVPPGDAGLQVTQIAFDSSMGCLRFRLRARRAPSVLPFYATASVESSFVEKTATRHVVSVAAHAASGITTLAPILVTAGGLARLYIHTANMNMLLEVRPLQRGRLGEVIRVQLPGTGRTLQARVTGEESLDATL
ncbi:MAG: flagella basal body P-ring formation protein FlgA [Candidatus Acidiferrum sp.]